MKRLIALLAFTLAATAPAAAQTTAIVNGRVVTNTDAGIIVNGTVLFENGQVTSVGANLPVPPGARVIDAGGSWVTPGVFAAYSQVGLIEVGLEATTNDSSARTSDFTAALDVADAFNPNATALAGTRIEGVTRLALFPSTGSGLFAGRGALANTSGEANSLFANRAFMFADVSQSGAATAGGARTAAWTYMTAALGDARAYPGRFIAHPEGDALTRYDAAAMVDVARGGTMLVLSIDRASDIRRAIRFQADNAPVRIAIFGGAEAWMVADELAEAGIPVLIDPIRNLPSSFDMIGANLDSARRLHEAGVTVAYTTQTADGYFNVRLLPQHAGNAVANGVPWEAAFRAITLTPAEVYGVGDIYGALAPGYAADVVIWDGDPLEVMSAPTQVFIDGVETGMVSRQTRLRDRYLDLAGETPFAYRR